jgi:hypothetical protein
MFCVVWSVPGDRLPAGCCTAPNTPGGHRSPDHAHPLSCRWQPSTNVVRLSRWCRRPPNPEPSHRRVGDAPGGRRTPPVRPPGATTPYP